MVSKTNPYRNGILEIFDTLSSDMGWNGFKKELARTTLKGALKDCTENEAEYYIKKMDKLIHEVLCLTETQLKP